ncbi:MAG: AsmA family protein [Nitrospirota bacterium]
MRKLLWAGGIILGVFLVAVLVLTVVVRSYLQSDRLKALIIPRIEALTGRQVTIDDIDVSLFKGIVIKGFHLKQADGAGDFLRTDEFILDYSLPPLLNRQLVITRVEIAGPYILVRRERDGRYNFSDMIERTKRGEAEKPAAGEEPHELPLSITTDRISLSNARLEFVDALNKLPRVDALISDGRLMASVGRSLAAMDITGYLTLESMKAVMDGIGTNTSGRIDIRSTSIDLSLATMIGKDTVRTTGTITGTPSAPVVRLDLSSKELDLERLLALSSGRKSGHGRAGAGGASKQDGGDRGVSMERSGFAGQEAPPIVLVADKRGAAASGGAPLVTASGTVTIGTAHYKEYVIRDFSLGYRYERGVVRLEPIAMRLSGGAQVAVEGTAAAEMLFRLAEGDAAAAVKRTLSGKGTARFSPIAIQQSPITDAVAVLTGIEALRSPRFDSSRFTFTIGNQRVLLEGTMDSPQIKVVPSGTVGFDKRLDMVADLRLSPELTASLSRAGRITGFLKDASGWSTVPLRITGTTEKPSVGLNTAAVQRQIQKGIQSELQRRLMEKLAPRDKGQAPQDKEQVPQKGPRPEDLLRDLFGK